MKKTYTNGEYIYTPASRWIRVDYKIITEKHSLFDYGTPDDIYPERKSICCFRHNGKLYALEQFLRLTYPVMLDDDNGTIIIGGYDGTNYYKPLLIEIHPDGECIRLWNEERKEG